MNDKYQVKIDNNDSRYVKLRKSLKDDISQKVQCEDYDKIINYIFALVFEHNKPKDEVKKEMEEIFQESADYIMDLLIRLLDKYYGNSKDENSNDLIEEIYEDKPSGSKVISSQVVKPTSSQEQKGGKTLYNQAINSVKESSGKRRQNQHQRNKFDQFEDNYKNNNNNNYQDRRNNDYNNKNNYNFNAYSNHGRYNSRRNEQFNQQMQGQRRQGSNYPREENINVGGRNLVIKKRRGSKNSRSRSRSVERDRSKERKGSGNNIDNNVNNNNSNNAGNLENEDYQQNYPQQQFNPNYQGGYQNEPRRQYMHNNYYQPARGPIFQPRRLGPFAARGRFPGRFMKRGGYLGPMNIARRAAAPVHATEGAKADNSQPIEQTQTNAQENPNVNSQNENIEHKEPHEQIHQHMPVEGSADDKTNKKKIRCRNWPICKNENCEYAHPTETCQYFPKCQFGSKCLYIHPNIPCKYGFYCTRPGCSYSHGSGYNPGMFGMMPPTIQPFNGNKFKKFPPKASIKQSNLATPASNESVHVEAMTQEGTQIQTENQEQMNVIS